MLRRVWNWFRSLPRKLKHGVPARETFYVVPIPLNLGNSEVFLHADGRIEGDYAAFEHWCKNTIVRAFPDERIGFWLLLQYWRMMQAGTNIPVSDWTMDGPLKPVQPLATLSEALASVRPSKVLTPFAGAVTVTEADVHLNMGQVERTVPAPAPPVKEAPRPRTVTQVIQTENGPKEFTFEVA